MRRWAVYSVVLSLMLPVGGISANGADLVSPFDDVAETDLFASSIVWLANQGITEGCNPPDNTRFCPDARVTRGQMAAFLARAFYLPAGAEGDRFIDDDGSVLEGAIEKLAAAGITLGCNPPTNTRFCPDTSVTRGQMAAFLVRAFGYTDGGSKDFVDDDGHTFEAAIEKLAAAGVTVGCNPPVNNRFCPDEPVTRGQMATFLRRAFGNPAVDQPGVNRIDPEHTLLPKAHQIDFATFDPDGQSTLTYSGKIDVGDVIVMGITPQTPRGFVGKVVAVDDGTVTTAPGSLMDAIPEAKGTIQADLTSGALEQQAIGFETFTGVRFACTSGDQTLDVNFGFDPGTLHTSWDWGLTGLRRLEVWSDPEVEARVTRLAIGAGCSAEIALAQKTLAPIIFSIGPVPVVIYQDVTLGLELSYSGDGEEIDLTGVYRGGLEIGGNFQGLLGTPIARNFSFNAAPLQGGWGSQPGSRTAEIFPNIAYTAQAYGLIGLSAKAGPYAEASVRPGTPCFQLDAGARAQLEAVAGVLAVRATTELARTDFLNTTLVTIDCPTNQPPTTTTIPSSTTTTTTIPPVIGSFSRISGLGQPAPDGFSELGTMSDDASHVAFQSSADGDLGGEVDGGLDVFLTDRASTETVEVSRGTTGIPANGEAGDPRISDSGGVIAFYSASDLIPQDDNGQTDVYTFDTSNNTLALGSVTSQGSTLDAGSSSGLALSGDGGTLAFLSDDLALVPEYSTIPANQRRDVIFVRNLASGEVSRLLAGELPNATTHPEMRMSRDGRYLLFCSNASNLVAGDTNGRTDLFLADRELGTVEIVSLKTDGTLSDQSMLCLTSNVSVSDDGSRILFSHSDTTLSMEALPAGGNWLSVTVEQTQQSGSSQLVEARLEPSPTTETWPLWLRIKVSSGPT